MKPPHQMEEVVYAAHEHIDPRLVGTRRLMTLTPSYLTTHQSEESPRVDLILLLKHYETPRCPLQGGTQF